MKSRLCIVYFDEDGEPMSYEAPDDPIAFRWKERDYWFDWTTDWDIHAKVLAVNCPIEYAYGENCVRQR